MDIQEKLMQNEALMEGLAEVQTADQLAALLAAHDVALEEGTSVEELLAQLKAEPTDELDEDALADVSGGVILAPVLVAGAVALAYWAYKNKKGKSKGGGGKGSFGGGGAGGR